MSGGHGHGSPNAGATHRWRLRVAFALIAAFFVVELLSALLSGSLALLSDAGHMAADVVALGAALVATRIAARPDTTGRRTFGSYRAEVFASGLAVLLMLGVAAYIVVAAVGRIGDEPEVATTAMLVVGGLGLVVNLVALAPGQVPRGRVTVLDDLGQPVELVEQGRPSLPQVVGDVGDRRPRQRRPTAPTLHTRHPVAELVSCQPGVLGQVGAREPAQGHGAEEPAVGGVLDPVLDQRDALGVLLDLGAWRAQAWRGVDQPAQGDVGGAPPVSEVTPVGELDRVAVGGRRQPLHDNGLAPDHGPPHAERGRPHAAGQRVPRGVGLPHAPDASRCHASGSATRPWRRVRP